jgi:hypothetical protein
LEREPRQPNAALELAHARWPRLDAHDGIAWEELLDNEPAWACVQLGRLALRLGLTSVARKLLDAGKDIDVGFAALYDLAVACEQLNELEAAEVAWARACRHPGEDLEAWRRLVLVRLRLGRFNEAGEALRRLRAAGGTDNQLVEAILGLLRLPRQPLLERARLTGWCAGRMAPALADKVPVAGLIAEIERSRPGITAERLDEVLLLLRSGLAKALVGADGISVEAGAIEAAVRVVLLALPFLGTPVSRQAGQCAAHALLACRLWSENALGQGRVPDTKAVREALLSLARVSVEPG